ncbi:MAG: MBL fold metallo-hydrolase, partial [Gammaproteobacteria bacterium]|nr:MBL fold metallo-hydrolase [Gammaproteobacteria bacterium]
AHTPGDAFIWLPDQRVMFTGDIVYVDRMLGVNSYSASRSWLEVFDAMAAFEPEVLVPGHGGVTTLEQASKDTRNYLVFLRETVMAFMDEGGTIENIGTLDLSSFNYLKNHEQLNGRNAQKVFQELEWE